MQLIAARGRTRSDCVADTRERSASEAHSAGSACIGPLLRPHRIGGGSCNEVLSLVPYGLLVVLALGTGSGSGWAVRGTWRCVEQRRNDRNVDHHLLGTLGITSSVHGFASAPMRSVTMRNSVRRG